MNLPAILKDGEAEQHARLTNLSEGGTAVRTAKAQKYASVLDFEFDLSPGRSISGKGQVGWINTEGVAGIILQIFHGMGQEHLESWLTTQGQLGYNKNEAD